MDGARAGELAGTLAGWRAALGYAIFLAFLPASEKPSVKSLSIASVALLAATPLTAQDRALAYDFPAVWRAGGLNAPDWAQFAWQDDLAFDGNGNLLVLDRGAGHIVKIDSDGRLVMTIGRSGEGPGEFRMLVDVFVWPDGSFAASDGGRDAFHLFNPDGSFERMVWWWAEMGSSPLGQLGLNSSRAMRPGPAGVIYAQGPNRQVVQLFGSVAELVGRDAGAGKSADERTIEVVHLDADVVRSEVVIEAWRPARLGSADAEPDLDDAARMMDAGETAPHFEPTLRWGAARDGTIAYADSSTYRVSIVRGGMLLRTLTRPIDPRPVTRSIQSDIRARMLRELDEMDDESTPMLGVPDGIDVAALREAAKENAREHIENMTFFSEVPVIGRIRVAWDGSVWVQREDVVDEQADGLIDVFDPDGSYVGTLPADGPGMPVAFGPGGRVAYWEMDELDVPSIVVRQLPAELWR